MGFAIFLGIILGLVIAFVIAGAFGEIAEMKGHSHSRYFWYAFLFGIAGMLMVVALPDMRNSVKDSSPERAETLSFRPAQPDVRNTVVTPAAAPKEPERLNDTVPAKAIIVDGKKVCPNCGTEQNANRHICWKCEQPFEN